MRQSTRPLPFVLLLSLLGLFSFPVFPACAQLPIPGSLGGNFGGDAIGTAIKGPIAKKITEALTKPIAEAVGANAPIKLDQSTAFPKTLDVQNFRPHFWMPTAGTDLNRHLPPGDYAIPVTAYCTDYSIHVPGRGTPYKLAPLEGREAKILSTILVRGTIQKVPHDTLQEINWRLQAGIPLGQWPEEEQATVHQLAPEDEKALQGDLLQQAESTYQKVSKTANSFPFNLVHASVPSFDAIISNMGAAGVQVRKIEAARQVLADQTATAERMPDLLYEKTGDGSPRILPPEEHPEASPWSEVRPGVLARFIVFDGRMGQNLYEFRITPEAKVAKSAVHRGTAHFLDVSATAPLAGAVDLAEWPTLSAALGMGDLSAAALTGAGLIVPGVGKAAMVGGGLLIAYSLGTGCQGLIPVPDFTWTNLTLPVSVIKIFVLTQSIHWPTAPDGGDDNKEGAESDKNEEVAKDSSENITKTIDKILQDSTPGRGTKVVDERMKTGGQTQADEDLDYIAEETATTINTTQNTDGETVRIVTFPDGTTIGEYPVSNQTGGPTIQIDRPGASRTVKIRYVR